MIQSLIGQNTPVFFHSIPAISNPLPHQQLAVSFDDPSQPPVVISFEEAERAYGDTLILRSDKPVSRKNHDLTVKNRLEVARRERFLKTLDDIKSTHLCGGVDIRQEAIDRVVEETGCKSIAPSTLGRWHKTAREHMDGAAATLRSTHIERSSKYSENVQSLGLQCIIDHFLKPGEPTMMRAYKKFVARIKKEIGVDVEYPCYGTFRNWIKNIDPFLIISSRNGNKELVKAKRNALKKLVTHHILERVEVDAVHLSVGIVDNEGNYLGTVTVYLVLDCYSRSVLGFVTQLGRGENAASAIDSMKHAIIPKRQEDLIDCQHKWPMHGLMERITSDGGSGYTAVKTQGFCLVYQISTQIVETGKGWKKPFVESFFGTLRMQFASELPGYCGKYTDKRQLDYTIKELATMTLDEFNYQLTRYIVDEYHQNKQVGLDGKSPYEMWSESAKHYAPMLPTDYERLRNTKGDVRKRVIQGHKGIRIHNVYYNDAAGELGALYHKLCQTFTGKPEVTCEYSPNDISSITVTDPFTDEIIVVDTYDERVRDGMSLTEFQVKYPAMSQKKKDIQVNLFSEDNPRLDAVKAQGEAKRKKHSSRRQRNANTDALTDLVIDADLAEKEALSREADTEMTTDEDNSPSSNTSSETQGYDYE